MWATARLLDQFPATIAKIFCPAPGHLSVARVTGHVSAELRAAINALLKMAGPNYGGLKTIQQISDQSKWPP